ncbi:TraB/GumN family protein [Thermococcus atlanticus]
MSYLRYVKVIGTMHVSPESRERVRRLILEEKPHGIAVELDRPRFLSMKSKQRMGFEEALKLGRRGFVAYLLARVEEKLGEEFGMMPGGEMEEAINLAEELGIPLFLIDEDISLIMAKILNAPAREKLLLLLESMAVFMPLGMGERRDVDVMTEYRMMMVQFKRRYPYLHRILVEERNEIMARNLISIVDSLREHGIKKPRVIAVVGLGHKAGIERILNSKKEVSSGELYV